MECCFSVKLCLAAFIVASVPTILPRANAADRAVVLVTSRDCAMDTIIALDIRKAYLGIVVSYEGHVIRPFRLSNDEQLNQIFFQYVVAMSEKTYERRLLRHWLWSQIDWRKATRYHQNSGRCASKHCRRGRICCMYTRYSLIRAQRLIRLAAQIERLSSDQTVGSLRKPSVSERNFPMRTIIRLNFVIQTEWRAAAF